MSSYASYDRLLNALGGVCPYKTINIEVEIESGTLNICTCTNMSGRSTIRLEVRLVLDSYLNRLVKTVGNIEEFETSYEALCILIRSNHHATTSVLEVSSTLISKTDER